MGLNFFGVWFIYSYSKQIMTNKFKDWIRLVDVKDDLKISMRSLMEILKSTQTPLFWMIPDKYEVWQTSWAKVLYFLSEGRNHYGLPRTNFSECLDESQMSTQMKLIHGKKRIVPLTELSGLPDVDLLPEIKIFCRSTWDEFSDKVSNFPQVITLANAKLNFNHLDNFYNEESLCVPLFSRIFVKNDVADECFSFPQSPELEKVPVQPKDSLYQNNLILVRESKAEGIRFDSAHFTDIELEFSDVYINYENYQELAVNSINGASGSNNILEFEKKPLKDEIYFSKKFKDFWNMAVVGNEVINIHFGLNNIHEPKKDQIIEYIQTKLSLTSRAEAESLLQIVKKPQRKKAENETQQIIGVTKGLVDIRKVLEEFWRPIVDKVNQAIDNEQNVELKEYLINPEMLPYAYWHYKSIYSWSENITQPFIALILKNSVGKLMSEKGSDTLAKISVIVPYYTQLEKDKLNRLKKWKAQ